MVEMRPRQYPVARTPPTTDERVVRLERTTATQAAALEGQAGSITGLSATVATQGGALATLTTTVTSQGESIATAASAVAGLPATSSIWSDARPTATFGTGSDLTWTATGNGIATSFAIPGRISTIPARYVVVVGGVQQPPSVFSLPTASQTLVFVEAPPNGASVHIHAPFYGTAP